MYGNKILIVESEYNEIFLCMPELGLNFYLFLYKYKNHHKRINRKQCRKIFTQVPYRYWETIIGGDRKLKEGESVISVIISYFSQHERCKNWRIVNILDVEDEKP